MRFSLLILVFIAHTSFSQFKNIKIDEDDGQSFHPCEPSIAINPANTDNIVATAILDRTYHTQDGGKTWHKQIVSSPHGVYGDPVVVAGDKDRFYFFHLSDPDGKNWLGERFLDRIVCQRSSKYGKKWNRGASIGLNHPKDQDKEWGHYDFKAENLYAVWTQFDTYGSKDESCQTNILFSKSGPRARKWTAPIRINELFGNCLDDDQTTEGAIPTSGPDGEIYVSWSYNDKIYFDRSKDGGTNWLKKDVVVADQPGGWTIDISGLNRSNGMPVIDCDRSMGNYSGSIYVNWSDQRNGTEDTDIWLSRSLDQGDTWSDPIRVNNDGTGSHQFLSWMSIDQTSGYLYLVFYDRRNHHDDTTDVYLAYSMDGGSSFVNIKISESSFVPSKEVFFGDYNNIAAHNGVITPIWTRMDDMKTSIWTTTILHDQLSK